MWRRFLNAANAALILFAAAVIGFAGWVVGTGRVDGARLLAIGRMIEVVPTDPQVEIPPVHVVDHADISSPSAEPISSAERLAALHENELKYVDASRRLERQAEVLRTELRMAAAAFTRERAEFEEERERWVEEQEAALARENDAAFQHLVRTLDAMPARDAANQIAGMIEAEGVPAAAEYLAAMPPWRSGEIIRWLRGPRAPLAAELLAAMHDVDR